MTRIWSYCVTNNFEMHVKDDINNDIKAGNREPTYLCMKRKVSIPEKMIRDPN